MRKKFIVTAIIAVSICIAGIAHADLGSFMGGLNIQARADMPGFSARLGAQFGIPLPQVQAIISAVDAPADAFMCLQLSQMSNRQPDMVLQTYKANKGKGWGVIAKELGIKPGSPEFHALKRGDFALTGEPGGGKGQGKGKGRGKGRGHNK